ncbi:hypothetical protein C4J93_3688 [Pseudomonas sp. R2-37-08W]|nr:hypothetical protein C4J93_3688 [Pseudomonas sp. R2-37-08W]
MRSPSVRATIPGRVHKCVENGKCSGLEYTAYLKTTPGANVGGGLLPMAAYQPPIRGLTHRHREQAPSHI